MFALLVGGCAASIPDLSPNATAVQVSSDLPPPTTDAPTLDPRLFRIGPSDTLSIQVFGVPDLTREGMVDATGGFSMPLIGMVHAAGLTPEQLATSIAQQLRGRYVRDPQVTVSVREVRSQRITIDGGVNHPGIYPVPGRLTLQQAVALAQGATEFAQTSQIVVFRMIGGRSMAARFSLDAIRAGLAPDPQVYADDVIVVGDSASRRRFRDILQALPALGVFTQLLVR